VRPRGALSCHLLGWQQYEGGSAPVESVWVYGIWAQMSLEMSILKTEKKDNNNRDRYPPALYSAGGVLF
jgi:hypothetical protein